MAALKTQGKPAGRNRETALTPQMVGFRLFKLTNLLSRPFFGRFARQHELTLNEWRTIVVIANTPGSAAQDVSAATGMHPMNVSRALAGLRQAGRIEDGRDPDNHRRTLLWLTKSGRKTFEEIAPHSEAQAKSLLGALTEAELDVMGELIDKLIAKAEEIAAEGDDE